MLLGLDLGTTAVKAALVDPGSGVIGRAETAHPTATDASGRHEQDPEQWWAAVRRVLDGLRAAGHRLAAVEAIGLSGHTHGLVLIDGDGAPVRPCLTWADQRAVAEARELDAEVGDVVRARCANPVIEAFTLPKLRWLARREPEALAAAVRLGLPKDYVRLRLTGRWATDPTDAASTLFYDVRRDAWDAELLEAAGGRTALLPEILPSSAVAGTVTAQAAADTGLPAGVPVAAGASDVACAALGAGADVLGVAYVNVGTAAQLMTPVAAVPAGDAYTFLGAGEQRFLAMTSVYSAGSALEWFAGRMLGREGDAWRGAVDEAVLAVPPGARGVLFLPYLLGASTPRPDARARGALLGLTAAHGENEALRAVIEGVALAIRVALGALTPREQAAGVLRIGGGPVRSPAWRRILADAIGADLEVVDDGSSVLGAAMLAGLAAGTFADPAAASRACVRVLERLAPDADAAAVYDRRVETFIAATEAVRSLSHRLAGGAG